jgi:hypothetical protein
VAHLRDRQQALQRELVRRLVHRDVLGEAHVTE